MIDRTKAFLVGEKIRDSEIFLSVYTKHYEDDPQCALELGIAVILNKPIFFLVPKDDGPQINKNTNVMSLASGVEFFDRNDPKSLEQAAESLLLKFKRSKATT